ncbi:hypothetical protein IWQ47_003625 [Aquimarina sp. EL_43]|uniref:hypothetical protein n=1 Tax=unclassified Aquimarina TaxID=2627091 RepID=UPI0018C8EC33|nr:MULTISPECIES: hypothetical protein [unclassified Aquimarina]MBG6132403.1 hypothetical protein [Aquimarina sp. EL_35]MBG6152534.1 hypothetical protein [Aquimarina sp. EL_32]MBG6170539.1 hypothetical protein [Aquimarina sp. EL_43]
MKTQRNFILLFLPLIILLFFSSCRNESDTFIESNENQSIKPTSKIASLMSKIAMNDGSIDNIIDNSTCFTVKLPVTVIANGSEEIINSAEDFQVIEDIFAEFNNDTDELEIIFPITVIFNDHTEVSVENQIELEAIDGNCTTNNENIECADFKYPFEISVFNSQSELLETITFNSDKELFKFLKKLKEEDIATINFPITLIFSDNTETTITSIENLQQTIENTVDSCDEDDTTTDLFTQTITKGKWEVQKYKDNQNNETQNYKDFVFTFSEDGSISVENVITNEIINGNWSVITRADGGLDANLEFGSQPPLDKLNNTNWNVKKTQENRIMLDDRKDGGVSKDELFFKKI